MNTLAQYIDHTMLKSDATPDDVRKLCDEAKQYGFASVCVNSSYIALAKQLLEGSSVKICSVVGFPLGAMSTRAKSAEALIALEDGANELDMVINIGRLKCGDHDYVRNEITEIAKIAHRHAALLKVIIETPLLTNAEKIIACRLIDEAGADFGKSCTGFNGGGATIDDAQLMKKALRGRKLKMSGKIDNATLAKQLIAAGADRLGTSKSIAIISGVS